MASIPKGVSMPEAEWDDTMCEAWEASRGERVPFRDVRAEEELVDSSTADLLQALRAAACRDGFRFRAGCLRVDRCHC